MQRFTAATCAVALLVISAALVHGQADVPPVPGQNNTAAGGPVLLDFTADWCGYCRQMEPVLDQLRQAGYAIRTVDVDRQPQIAQQFRAHSLPCFVMVVDGQEVDRVVGATSGQRLAQMFAAAKQLAPQSAAPAVSPTHPDASPRTGGPPATFAQTSGPTQPPVAQLAVSKSHEPFRPSADATSSPRGDASAGVPSTFAPSTQDLAAAAPAVAPSVASIPGSESEPPLVSAAEGVDVASVPRSVIDRALAASVRLRVEDSDGRSWGSGTIVDVSAGRALIVTCAHIFRESAGNAPVTIDLFGDDTPKGLTGKVVSYDLPSDVALVSFDAPVGVHYVKVAPATHTTSVRQPVVSVGCGHGTMPTAIVSRVVSLDRFLGPPNLQVAGQPIQGRSGGGLFSADGRMIGVCNAADPQDDQGLYAALGAIHAELDRAGRGDVFAPASGDDGTLLASADSSPFEMAPAMPERRRAADEGGPVNTAAHGTPGGIPPVRPAPAAAPPTG
ncbi:MAG: trypsin-like peptidase domain-containing protein, partial [Planctomycetales bacterium]|nr:trypsin-like peptidase domain-containing protein [Planctomycetales bacterium]